jgi:CRP-like cAMP-binding protein
LQTFNALQALYSKDPTAFTVQKYVVFPIAQGHNFLYIIMNSPDKSKTVVKRDGKRLVVLKNQDELVKTCLLRRSTQGLMNVKKNLHIIRSKTEDKKSLPISNSVNYRGQSEGFLTSFCNDPQNNHYFSGQSQVCPAQVVIFRQDTPAKAVYLVEQGLVKLVRITYSGEQVIVGLRHRNWLIGAPSIFLGKQYSYTAIAVIPTILRSITKKSFLELVEKNIQFSLHVHRMLSENIYSQMRHMAETSFMSAQERLEFLLSDMIHNKVAIDSTLPDTFTLPLTNQELAQLLAISPEHLCRVLKGMAKKGLIRRDYGKVVVTNPSSFLQKSMD